MRAETDTRDLASMTLPPKFSFVMNADAAELWTPEGERIPFSEGYSVASVEATAECIEWEKKNVGQKLAEMYGEIVRSQEPDLHELLSEVLDATGWTTEKREEWLSDYYYALCAETEEMRAVDEEWRDGSDPGEDALEAGWRK